MPFEKVICDMMQLITMHIGRGKVPRKLLSAVFAAFILLIPLLSPDFSRAVMIDQVIAYVDDRAITYSELRARHELISKSRPDMTEHQTLDSMINALLMLQKAKKLRLEAPTEDDLIREYMEAVVKSRISVSEDEVRKYYDSHRKEFGGKDFDSVRGGIEKYLTEVETNRKLLEHVRELRSGANIVIKLKDK